MIESVLIPVDGSPQSSAAVEYAGSVFPDVDVRLLTVLDPVDGFAGYESSTEGNFETQARDRAREILEAEQRSLEGAGMADTQIQLVVEVGQPVETITEIASQADVDQIIIGSHGRTGLQRIIVGSVAEHVMRAVSMPVTIVR
jgi:nucleotide-binding universal stress UspA family protein